jgi:hypothetical protein
MPPVGSAFTRRARFGRWALVWALVWALAACRREPEPTRASDTPLPSPTPAAPAVAEAPFRWAATERMVAVGDLHGDLAATQRALYLAGAMDEQERWIGGKLTLVQTGDLLDRGDDEPAILRLFDRLEEQARAAGGAVVQLVGNHEILNVEGDFRYVTVGGFLAFADVKADPANPLLARFAPEARGRAAAFLPGGPEARRLAKHPTVALVGRTLFAHGGVLPEHANYGLGRLNGTVAAWLRGELRELPDLLRGERSPYWTRRYSDSEPSKRACRELAEVLGSVGAERLVVGHTVQEKGISSGCGERVWRIDVGLAAYYGRHGAEVLEVRDANVKVLAPEP